MRLFEKLEVLDDIDLSINFAELLVEYLRPRLEKESLTVEMVLKGLESIEAYIDWSTDAEAFTAYQRYLRYTLNSSR